MKTILMSCLFLFSMHLATAQQSSLAGKWSVALGDPSAEKKMLLLPGTLDDAGIGDEVVVKPELTIHALAHLTRRNSHVGKAFYSRKITVPKDWKGKRIHLVLERVMWRSTIFIDGASLPAHGESLSAEHRFDLTDHIRHGQSQVLTVCVDNSNAFPGINIEASQYPDAKSREMAHGYTNHTQIKWNGILGDMYLEASPQLHATAIRTFPDPFTKILAFELQLNNPKHRPFTARASVRDPASGIRWPVVHVWDKLKGEMIRGQIQIPSDAENWDEFNPKMYTLEFLLQSAQGVDTVQSSFGIRHIGRKEGELQLNGGRIFLRGNLECSIFPLTGYPPTGQKEWMELFRRAKSFGLNHLRFHSWCPPAAAFEVADALGFYLQVELPHWNLKVGTDSLSWRFLTEEAGRIMKSYGNHPSFVFFSLGNELEGDFNLLGKLTDSLRKADSRHMYATTSFTFQKGITGMPQPADDFFVTQWTNNGWIRGQGIFNDKPPDFSTDYATALKQIKVPVISHEIGQYCVFPDIEEIGQYTGNLLPRNLEAVRDDLKRKGLLPLANDYVRATAAFASILYKEEMERALKTSDFDGFQLLQLQDFPGQGTALVGLLNAFWKPKPGISDSDFRRASAEFVMLARFPKAIYLNDEPFNATIEVANFFRPLSGAVVSWSLRSEGGTLIQSGRFAQADIPVGNSWKAGSAACGLSDVSKATKLIFTVSLEGYPYKNSWDVWVYPSSASDGAGDVLFTRSWKEAVRALNDGRKVLLNPDSDSLKGIAGKFVPVFWSPVHFPDQPGTMGLLIRDLHPAFKDFPTDPHSNWQWWDLCVNSKTLDAANIRDTAILVRVIDNFVRNGNLANLLEFKFGKGSLMLCSIDMAKDMEKRPQARQLRQSLLGYMNSPEFSPVTLLHEERLADFFR